MPEFVENDVIAVPQRLLLAAVDGCGLPGGEFLLADELTGEFLGVRGRKLVARETVPKRRDFLGRHQPCCSKLIDELRKRQRHVLIPAILTFSPILQSRLSHSSSSAGRKRPLPRLMMHPGAARWRHARFAINVTG